MIEALFGTKSAAMILLYIENYDEGTPSGIARGLGMNKNRVYVQLVRLETGGILVARKMDNLRVFSINPRLPFKAELRTMLRRILDTMPIHEFDKCFSERRRPRKTGKSL